MMVFGAVLGVGIGWMGDGCGEEEGGKEGG